MSEQNKLLEVMEVPKSRSGKHTESYVQNSTPPKAFSRGQGLAHSSSCKSRALTSKLFGEIL